MADWCYTFDFTESNGGWSPLTDGTGGGVWVSGSGWQHTCPNNNGANVRIKRTFPATTLTYW